MKQPATLTSDNNEKKINQEEKKKIKEENKSEKKINQARALLMSLKVLSCKDQQSMIIMLKKEEFVSFSIFNGFI